MYILKLIKSYILQFFFYIALLYHINSLKMLCIFKIWLYLLNYINIININIFNIKNEIFLKRDCYY